ncbi:hypothetical protein RRG08_032045 [Elysia crispata]|uniref:Uncharacterized protein n=1 Tax=Elysia crispata TaxID=231223 RepID=A0AAE0XW12_9GAST|nr:hypothetical protein RRG08_032045 [Elysia crispata]
MTLNETWKEYMSNMKRHLGCGAYLGTKTLELWSVSRYYYCWHYQEPRLVDLQSCTEFVNSRSKPCPALATEPTVQSS